MGLYWRYAVQPLFINTLPRAVFGRAMEADSTCIFAAPLPVATPGSKVNAFALWLRYKTLVFLGVFFIFFFFLPLEIRIFEIRSKRRMKLKLTGVSPDFYLEFVVMQNLIKEFRELGFIFTKAYPHAVIEDEENVIFEECDITLENNDTVMIVDVISVPTVGDIGDHVERLRKIRTYAYTHGDNRTFLGAIAGMIINDKERDFALKCGMFVIEPAAKEQGRAVKKPLYDQEGYTGETFTITMPKCNNLPADMVRIVNDLYLENEQIAKILSEDVKHPPTTPAFPATKTVFPSPLRNKHQNRYARQS
jgi:hypothetical protein